MKRIINYIIIFFITFLIINIDSIHATIKLNIDEDGQLIKDDSYQDEYDNYYTLENGVLNLTKSADSFSSPYVYEILTKSELVINASNNVYIRHIDAKRNLEIKSSNKNNTIYLPEIMGGGYSEELYIHDITIDHLGICVWFNKFIIDSAILNPEDSNYSVEFDGNMTIQGYEFYVGDELVYKWTWDFAGMDTTVMPRSFDIKDSHINAEIIYARHGSLSVHDSSITLKPGGWDYKPFMYARNSEVTIKGSSIERGQGVEQADFEIFDSNYDATFEDSTFNVNSCKHYVWSGASYFEKKDYIKNCTFNVDTFYGFSAIMENTTVNTTKLSSGYIDAKDSTINISTENGNTNDLNIEFLKLDNSRMNNPGGGQLYTSNMYQTDYSIKLVNSHLELTGNARSIGSNGMYIENSTFKSDTEMIWTNLVGSINTDEERNGSVIVKNSVFEANNLVARNDLKLIDSNVKLQSLELDRDSYYQVGGTLRMTNSNLHVNNTDDESLGVYIYDLDFNNSHLIAEGTDKAWFSTIDVTTHNLAGINKTNTVIPMDTDQYRDGNRTYDGYSFYDNNVLSKYVEIKSPLKVTFKIVNGTWNDGTTEDKIVETYFFGSIKDVDVPKDMIANTGYGNGSWDKEIIYDELKDEYIYTYTFKEAKEEDQKEPKKEEKKSSKKEEKLKNPDTGAFISLITIVILIIGCIKVLKYTKKNKRFNRL